MSKVIDIQSKQPHMNGEAICLNCNHEWQAVTPVGVHAFDCPSCSLSKGVFKGLVGGLGKIWTCNCKCQYFFITETETVCVYCGQSQIFS